VRNRVRVRVRVRVSVRLFSPLHHLHCAICITPNTESRGALWKGEEKRKRGRGKHGEGEGQGRERNIWQALMHIYCNVATVGLLLKPKF